MAKKYLEKMAGWKDKKIRWMVGWLRKYMKKNTDGWMDKK